MDYSATLPHVTAALNGITVVLLIVGLSLIKLQKRTAHRAVMISAVAVSAAFLAVYLVYHYTSPINVFKGEGFIKQVYYFILISHVVLAAINLPMILITFSRGLRQRFDAHRAIARWTYPVWMYVSVTGVVVYVMLYHLYATAG